MGYRHIKRCSTSLGLKYKSKPQRDIISHLLEWLLPRIQETTVAGEVVLKRDNLYTLLVKTYIGPTTTGNNMEVPTKLKSRSTMPSSNSTSVCIYPNYKIEIVF